VATNKYFKPYSYGREQDTAEDLIIESIKIYGLEVKYLPRTIINQDFLLGEDPLGKFNSAIDIEVYVKNIQGFEGEGDFLSKFNLEIRDQITFTMARKRFAQIASEKLTDEVGFNYQVETANTGAWGASDSYVLETGSANGYSITTSRPMEGDLIFFPLNNKLYEIKFVEHENIFYQHGKLYTYDIQCELYDRDSRLDTGNTAIDIIESNTTMDILTYQFLDEAGDNLLIEDGGYMLQEYRLERTAPLANNEYIMQQSLNFVNWSEHNPFSENDRDRL
jgi:hypothetical protein